VQWQALRDSKLKGLARQMFVQYSQRKYVLILQWDTKANGRHALDYITHYDRIGGYGGVGNIPEVADVLDLSMLMTLWRP
jgi:hypothetical protein